MEHAPQGYGLSKDIIDEHVGTRTTMLGRWDRTAPGGAQCGELDALSQVPAVFGR